MKKLTIVLFVFFVGFISESYALPRFALRTGGACIDCHVNPTGGGMRNESGWGYGKNNLKLFNTYSNDEFEMSPYIGKNILFGIDYRTQYLAKFDSTQKRTDFQNMTGAVYLNIEANEYLNLYAHYDFVQSLWQGYAIANILPFKGYIKVGTFSPNFGIRTDDHTAYTRGGDFGILASQKGLIYDPFYSETGIELGFNFNEFTNFTVSAGNPSRALFIKDPTYTTRLQFTPSFGDLNLLAGGSYASYKRGFLGNIRNINMYGGFFGLQLEEFSLLAEYDMAKSIINQDSLSTALMIEVSYRITKGLEAVVRYDRFDRNTEVTKDELSRIVLGVEFFPYSFIEIRPQFRINMEEPKIDNNAFVLQFHFWY
ncbi:MAG: hypothetical protein Q8N03_01090 [Ignavibacteria bacterium]|nr:hypothetical protein [Ignavibacteria bacterium]